MNLNKIRGPTMQQSGCHRANSLASNITTDLHDQLQNRDTQLLTMLKYLPSISEESTDSDRSNDSSANEMPVHLHSCTSHPVENTQL